ncbi:MAG: TRAP transporter small permease subunit [Reyranellaceae bacterium]
MPRLLRSLDLAADGLLLVGGVAIFAMMLHITADVLMKLLFNAPLPGALEIVTYIYMVACTFLPLAHVMTSRSMIVVEVFTQGLSPKTLLRLESWVALLSCAYFGAMAVMSGLQAVSKTRMGEIQDATYFELPVWPMRWVVVLACALVAIAALASAVDDWRLLRTGKRFDRRSLLRSGENAV